MSDNVYWVIFWLILLGSYSLNSYFDNKTKQMKIQTEYKIKQMNNKSNINFRKSLEEITNKVIKVKD